MEVDAIDRVNPLLLFQTATTLSGSAVMSHESINLEKWGGRFEKTSLWKISFPDASNAEAFHRQSMIMGAFWGHLFPNAMVALYIWDK